MRPFHEWSPEERTRYYAALLERINSPEYFSSHIGVKVTRISDGEADGELLAAERCHTGRADRLLSERERAAAEELRRAAKEGGTRAALARFKKIIDDPSIKS